MFKILSNLWLSVHICNKVLLIEEMPRNWSVVSEIFEVCHPAVTSKLISGFVKVVLGSFDNQNFRRPKHQLNANKYFFKTFFANQGAKLYVIMQK